MQKIVNVEMPKIEIGGMEFELRMSDGDVYAAGRDVVAECAHLQTGDPWAVRIVIERICGVIDEALGSGAMAKIAQGKPVSLAFALKVFNGIVESCAARYSNYIRREYLPSRKEGKR